MSAAARIVAAVLLGLLAFSAASARTVVITIGNDRGLAGDLPLRYAARDATRFGEVMRRLGAVAATVLLVSEAADAIVGTRLDDTAMEKLAQACSAAASPIDDKRGTVHFRKKVAGVLATRAARIAYERAGGK